MGVQIINESVLDGLRQLPDESVHCCVTSPPYWGLRDYGTGRWEGGDPNCLHKVCGDRPKIESSTLRGGKASTGHQQEGFKSQCPRCGAKRIDDQIGLEPTPDAFVAKMVEVFREVRRVLRSDGTLWLNLGDSYQNAKGQAGGIDPKQPARRHGLRPNDVSIPGLKPKDLVGIPWMVAFALRADGWYLRSDIVWNKPNPMPESVTDRPTKAHEYIFLLSKSERYFYDAEAIKESASYAGTAGGIHTTMGVGGQPRHTGLANGEPYSSRNKRSVWTIATAPFPEAHFATFPPELPELCIKAGCQVGGTVLDPFGGAGTTGLVADRLQRNGIMIELNPEYAAMARRRIDGDRGGLLDLMEAVA